MRIVAIDQGTTSTKGVVVDADGELRSLSALRHGQILPQSGWVEHSATELLANVTALVDAGAQAGATGVALANQGETVVAWDRRTGQPLSNAIVWQDQRTTPLTDALIRDGNEATVRALSGLPLDPYFSATKLRWLLDNVAECRDLARQGRLGIGTTDSYFVERLTGRYATDVTTASRTSLMNIRGCEWDARLCDLFGVPIDLLPEIAADGEPIGEVVTPSGPVRLLASIVDQIAALYGHGCRRPGDGKVSIGTGAFALAITGFEAPADLDPAIIPTAAWLGGKGRAYAADGGVYTAAAAVEWLMRIGLLSHLEEIAALTGTSAAERHLFFVPALAGLACPHWDRSATGLFIGLDTATSREDMIKAVLEGVAFRIAEVVEALGFAPASVVSVDGGLSRSRYFTQFLADISGRPIRGCDDSEVTAFGAAALARTVAERADPGAYLPIAYTSAEIAPAMSSVRACELRADFSRALHHSTGWRTM